jgi:hypothetical protein
MCLSFNPFGRGYFEVRGAAPSIKETAMPEQLGTIGDVLRILIKQINRDGLDAEERRAVNRLECQLDEIDRSTRQP